MNSYVVDAGIYRHDIVFVQGEEEECIKYFNENFEIEIPFLKENINEFCGGCVMIIYPQMVFVWVRDEITNLITDNYDLLHEIFHATSFIMRCVNTPLIVETEEPFAYLFSHIIFQLMKQVVDQSIKKESKKKCTSKKKPLTKKPTIPS